MRLYKTELYKFCHKKILPAGVACIFASMLLLFILHVNEIQSTINGTTYHGYAAIKADRQITSQFKGILTDEKIRQITEQYGFPQKVEKYYGLTDANFLNHFVMKHASDGYIYGWDDYKIATKVLPLADTQLGQTSAAIGQEILLEYYEGWSRFTEWYQLGMILLSILILCTVSPAFSSEEQAGIKSLLFTTKEGPTKDNLSKIAAAFTMSALLWIAITLFALLLYGIVYGWSGLKCMTGLVENGYISLNFQLTLKPFGLYLADTLLLNLLGVLELCAITLCISARCHSTFHSVSIAAVCWLMPILIFFMLFEIYRILSQSTLAYSVLLCLSVILFLFQCLLYSSPFYLTNPEILWELSVINSRNEILPVWIAVSFACVLLILCTIGAYHRYRSFTA